MVLKRHLFERVYLSYFIGMSNTALFDAVRPQVKRLNLMILWTDVFDRSRSFCRSIDMTNGPKLIDKHKRMIQPHSACFFLRGSSDLLNDSLQTLCVVDYEA